MPSPPGRPTKLHHLTAAPTADDPKRRLTVEAYICELMEATGRRAALCGNEAGVGRRTVEGWLTAGAAAELKEDSGKLLYPDEVRLLGFLRNTRAAHARWTRTHLEALSKLAAGGLTLGKVVEKVDPTRKADGTKVAAGEANPRPFVLERKVEQSMALPSETALRFLLERQALDEDGTRVLAPRVEVTGADGEPLGQGESRDDRVRRLIGEAEALAAGAATQRELDAARTNGAP